MTVNSNSSYSFHFRTSKTVKKIKYASMCAEKMYTITQFCREEHKQIESEPPVVFSPIYQNINDMSHEEILKIQCLQN